MNTVWKAGKEKTAQWLYKEALNIGSLSVDVAWSPDKPKEDEKNGIFYIDNKIIDVTHTEGM